MEGVPHIYIDNVAKYYWEHIPNGTKAASFAPVIAPPFPRCVFDYRWPIVLGYARPHLQVEMNAIPLEKEDTITNRVDHWGEPFWIMSFWSVQHPMGPTMSVLVAQDGSYCSKFVTYHLAEEEANNLAMLFSPCLLAITFMHCKNIEVRDIPPTRQQRRQAERKNKPLTVYKELIINPFQKKMHGEPTGQDSQEVHRALHICRGHFSTYSDERPLFGKYAGTFWIPMHVKGNKKYGEVKKDYKIDTGE